MIEQKLYLFLAIQERKLGYYTIQTRMSFFYSRDVVFSEKKFPGVDTEEYVTPPLNTFDPTIDD